MDWIIIAYVVLCFAIGYLTAAALSLGYRNSLKRENERLNAELHKLTDRDERGRFKGGK